MWRPADSKGYAVQNGEYQISKTYHGVDIGPPQVKYTLWKKRDKWPFIWQHLGVYPDFATAKKVSGQD